ncbi:MAG: DUF2846 domain-containing protein [Deltaproteobacteria bacterium]|nr:DUF2846 domain-containing protein [Deltaproteobacteria bacterium]
MVKKIKLLSVLVLLIMSLFTTGCLTASLGPKFTKAITPESDKAIIYVYRQRGVMTAQEMPGVKVNDVEVVDILPEISYFPLSVDPGKYIFTPKLFGMYKTTEAVVDAEAGNVYFVRLKVAMGHLEFDHMNRDEAMAYMATCHLLDPKYYRDPRVMSGQQASAISKSPEKVVDVAKAPEKAIETPVAVKTEDIAEEIPRPEVKVVKDTKARLYVDANPSNARVRIMNIAPVFEQGIRLNEGRYDVEVSASGYLSHREWVSLSAGENKHLQVLLEPEKKPIVEQMAKAEKTMVQKQASVTPVITQDEKKDITGRISAEEKRYAEMLQSGSANEIRNAAKNIYYRYYTNDYLTGLAEQALIQNYSRGTTNIQIDAMAWLCKVLARTGDARFADTLRSVAKDAPHRKLRGHAEKSLGQL